MMPRVLAVHDLACIGRCSLSVILPVLSALNVQCCPLPTSVFSSHTYGFGKVETIDLTNMMSKFLRHWQRENISFDAVYSGFLGSAEQIQHVRDAICIFSGKTVLVDPVMGDNGHIYRTYTSEMCEKMKLLVNDATIITPNVTEAAILLGLDLTSHPKSMNEAFEWVKALSCNGQKRVVITGADTSQFDSSSTEDMLGCIYTDGITSDVYLTKRLGGYFPGTGDIFASVLLGFLLNDTCFKDAVISAADFVGACIHSALLYETETREGVPFESLLYSICLNKHIPKTKVFEDF